MESTLVVTGPAARRPSPLALAVCLALGTGAARAEPVGDEFRVNTTVASAQTQSDVAVDAAGNFVAVRRSSGQDGSGSGVYLRRFGADGLPMAPEQPVNNHTTGNQQAPAVAMDGDGDFVVVWTSSGGQDGDGDGVFARRYAADGTVEGVQFQVNTYTTNKQGFPAVGADAKGDIVVTSNSLTQDGDGYGIYGQRFVRDFPYRGEIEVSFLIDRSPSVALDGDGDFVVVWTSVGQDGAGDGIYARLFAADGTDLGPEFPVNTYTTNHQSLPAVAMDADGDFVVAWRYIRGEPGGIRAQTFPGPGCYGEPLQVFDTKVATGSRLDCVS